MKVAIIGASGFAGSAVLEYLLEKGVDTVPLVGSTGNSWRLSSQGITPRIVSVLDAAALREALRGCTHVVNCMRGDENVMLQGTRNLVRAALRAGATRLVHLSSVAIYGDCPPSSATAEAATPKPERGTYGWIKLQQDEIVRNGTARGLKAIILCPPNIIGPGSYFLLELLGCMLRGEFLLADGGRSPCSTVDMRNLAHACFLALTRGSESGQRYFVTDDEATTWACVLAHLRMAGEVSVLPRECTLEALGRLANKSASIRASPWRSIKHLLSSEVRAAIRGDPLLARIDAGLRALVAMLGPSVEDKLRLAIEGPISNPRRPNPTKINVRLSAQQLRGVWHRNDRARSEFGYRAIVSFDQSMAAFSCWLASTRGMSAPDWELRRILFGYSVKEPSSRESNP